MPYKASKLKPLIKDQKKRNKELSSERIRVENKIREIKIFDIFDEKYRNK